MVGRYFWKKLGILLLISPFKSFLYAGEFKESILLKIDKKALRASLETLPSFLNKGAVLAEFPIAIGKNEGDKLHRGDNKTPEGIYFTRPHIAKESLLTAKYGELAIPLDFPNPVDLYEKKTGYGIWLHGAGDDKRMEEKTVTEGCVAFFNADILKLSKWLKPGHSIVVTAKDGQEINNERDRTAVLASFNGWLSSWQKRSIDDYISFYHPDFTAASRGKNAYKQYKKRVFSTYKKMQVDMKDTKIITHPKYAVTIANQDFRGDNRFSSIGKKVLYWVKNQDKWTILREDFENRRFTSLVFSDKDQSQLVNR